MKLKSTIETKLMGGTIALFALAAVLGYSGLSTSGNLKDHFRKAAVTLQNVVLTDKIGMANSEMISAQRGIVLAALAKDHAEMEKDEQIFQQQGEVIRRSMEEAHALLIKEEAKALLAAMAADVSEWQPHHRELLRQAGAGHVPEANRIRKEVTAPIYNRIAAAAIRLQGVETEMLAEDQAAVNDQSVSSRRIALSLLALCVVAGLIVIAMVRIISRDIRRAVVQLAEGTEQVASAAVQVSSASQSLAQGASEQAASLEETSASSEEVSSMTRKNAENSKVAAEFTGQVDQRVGTANRTLGQMVASMAEINQSQSPSRELV